MPEINNMENPQLQEIAELERQLAEKKAAMQVENGTPRTESSVEISRENVAEAQTQYVATQQTTAPTNVTVKQNEVEHDTRSISMMDESRKIETLVAIALEKGIAHCIEVANGLQDPYILDTLHDKLIGELHDRLVREKKLKEV